jgi:hypothetical protein
MMAAIFNETPCCSKTLLGFMDKRFYIGRHKAN